MTCCQQLLPLPNNGLLSGNACLVLCVYTCTIYNEYLTQRSFQKKSASFIIYRKSDHNYNVIKITLHKKMVYPTSSESHMLFIVNTRKFSEYKSILYLISRYTVFVFNYIYLCKPRRLQSVYYGFKSLQFRHLFNRIISSMNPLVACVQ